MEHQTPFNYRGFSIEHERDGTYSIFSVTGYMQGGLESQDAAKRFIDNEWFGYPEEKTV